VPCLGIDETLARLVPSPVRLLRTAGAGDDGPVGHYLSLVRREELCVGDAVRQEEEQRKGPEKRGQAEDDEHPHPGMQRMLNMADAVGQQTCDEPANRVSGEPDARAKGDLVARVPGGGDEHERRGDGGFGDTEQETHGQQAAVVDTCSSQSDDGAPEKGVDGEVFGHGQPGYQDVGGILPEEIAKVEDARHPAVLLADKMLFLLVCFTQDQNPEDLLYRQSGQKLTRSTESPCP
jgi:hypothetical protein